MAAIFGQLGVQMTSVNWDPEAMWILSLMIRILDVMILKLARTCYVPSMWQERNSRLVFKRGGNTNQQLLQKMAITVRERFSSISTLQYKMHDLDGF